MKNSTLKIVVVFFLALGLTTANAQDKVVKKDAPSSLKAADKVKDQKSDFDEKLDATKGSLKESGSTVNGTPDQIKKDAINKGDNTDDEIKKIKNAYSKKIRSTKDPKEQAKLKEEMMAKINEIKAANQTTIKEGASSSAGNDSESSSSASLKPKEKPKADTQVNKGKPTVAIKNEKVSATKASISNRRKSLDNRKAMVENANAKVAAARAKLDAAKEEGSLSKEEIAAKEAKIVKAEAQIKKLEASIDKAEKKFDENDSKLSDFEKNKEN